MNQQASPQIMVYPQKSNDQLLLDNSLQKDEHAYAGGPAEDNRILFSQ